MVKLSAQFDVVYWSYCPETPLQQLPHSLKKVPSEALNQKDVAVSQVETIKYPEAETWHRWMVLL